MPSPPALGVASRYSTAASSPTPERRKPHDGDFRAAQRDGRLCGPVPGPPGTGRPAAAKYLRFDGHPSEIYVRTAEDDEALTTRVHNLLAAQANPENPSQVDVSRPSDALTAQADAKGTLDTLFLGLGAVALLVGAIGVANIMIISVLERRQEIGLRRALGATRGQIRIQFLAEAIMLSFAGGAAGVLTGAASTTWYARAHHEATVIPFEAWAGGLAAAIVIGAIAGLLPAIRAARLSPTEALWTV
jgi:putative ABC transport system permease protein